MKLIRKLVTGLMILLVALGSSPLEVFGVVPNPGWEEWPRVSSGNGTASDLPEPPAKENIVNLSQMFNYPTLDYDGIPRDSGTVVSNYLHLNSYVTDTDSSVAVLTRDSTWQAGVMWSLDDYKVRLNEPFHMVSYVYLGNKGQKDGGADGITFTMHNDKKDETLSENDRKVLAGNVGNYGIDAYGALGNGLGIYGSNFSAADGANRYVYMKKGVTNGIALEFDTFYNDENGLNGKQFSDNDLWSYARPQGSERSNYGHIAINLLNDIQDNRANEDWETLNPQRYKKFSTSVYDYDYMIKHKDMLAVGWDGTITGLDPNNGWQIGTDPSKPLADNMWHRLEVIWTPTPNSSTTGDLTYLIYRDGHNGERNVYSIEDTTNDGSNVLEYTIKDLDVQSVFDVSSTADSVYWGFSGSTGGFQNNQAVQMLQLPVNYYTAELSKVDQGGKPVSGASFQIQKKNETTGEWEVQKIYNPDPETTGDGYTLETGSQDQYTEIYDGVYQSLGKIKLTQLTSGTYRWKEIEPPAGYQLEQEYYPDEDGFLVNFSESQKQEDEVFNIPATNKKLYQLELTKTEAGTDKLLNDVPFIFSKTENDKQYYLKVNADTNVFEWTEVRTDAVEKSFLTGKSYLLGQDGTVTEQIGEEGKIIVKYFPDAPNLSWEEVEVPAGYDSSGPLTGDFTPSTDGYVYSATQTNKPKDFVLTLEKLSSTFQKPLQGVKFKLYDSDDSAGEPDFSTLPLIDTVITGADGKIVLNNGQIQADNTYYLVESDTVEGFIRLKGYFTITTSKTNGFTDVTYTKAGTETDESPPFDFESTSTDTSYAISLQIYNKRESTLPATGGNGILGYVGIGLTMTIVALLFFIARKRIFKWLIILLVATSGLAGLAGGTQVVSAQEQEQVQLEVNRLVYQPSDTQYKSGVPVAGAKLEVVDVTKSFYELVNRQKLSLKEAQEAVSKSNKIDGQSLAVATTDRSGLVRFTVSKTSQQRPAVYLIRELLTPVAVTKMENMVVVLPILDESGNEKSLISLFPKSHGTFTFDKTIDEKQSSYSFGEPIPYRLSTIIPQDMTNLSSYEIEDIYDQGLRFISDSLEIFIDGEKQSDSIKAVSLSENQFRVVFDVAKLADFSGKKLEVTYQMVIKDEAAIDQDLVNTATLYPGDLTPLVDRENVQTGGFRFIKRAAEGKQNPLAKATFVIKNPTDDTVLTYKEGKYQFEKVATNASGVVRLTSDDDGYFEIRGLRYGEYLVSEIRAPSGYVLNDKPTAFTVGVSTYSQGPVLSIFNVKKPKIRLPETGTVVTSTAFVGLLIMASSLVMIRRRKDN